MTAFLGEIVMGAWSFAPTGFAACSGQLLGISQHTALFSLLGTQYGGDGLTTFALPDLNGRVPIGVGQGPGLTQRFIGEAGGEDAHALIESEMPAHTHAVPAAGAQSSRRGGRGGATPRQPYLAITYVIALTGAFPPRF
jgi:microcystin-dependent protein